MSYTDVSFLKDDDSTDTQNTKLANSEEINEALLNVVKRLIRLSKSTAKLTAERYGYEPKVWRELLDVLAPTAIYAVEKVKYVHGYFVYSETQARYESAPTHVDLLRTLMYAKRMFPTLSSAAQSSGIMIFVPGATTDTIRTQHIMNMLMNKSLSIRTSTGPSIALMSGNSAPPRFLYTEGMNAEHEGETISFDRSLMVTDSLPIEGRLVPIIIRAITSGLTAKPCWFVVPVACMSGGQMYPSRPNVTVTFGAYKSKILSVAMDGELKYCTDQDINVLITSPHIVVGYDRKNCLKVTFTQKTRFHGWALENERLKSERASMVQELSNTCDLRSKGVVLEFHGFAASKGDAVYLMCSPSAAAVNPVQLKVAAGDKVWTHLTLTTSSMMIEVDASHTNDGALSDVYTKHGRTKLAMPEEFIKHVTNYYEVDVPRPTVVVYSTAFKYRLLGETVENMVCQGEIDGFFPVSEFLLFMSPIIVTMLARIQRARRKREKAEASGVRIRGPLKVYMCDVIEKSRDSFGEDALFIGHFMRVCLTSRLEIAESTLLIDEDLKLGPSTNFVVVMKALQDVLILDTLFSLYTNEPTPALTDRYKLYGYGHHHLNIRHTRTRAPRQAYNPNSAVSIVESICNASHAIYGEWLANSVEVQLARKDPSVGKLGDERYSILRNVKDKHHLLLRTVSG